MTDLTTFPKTELNAMLVAPLNASALKKIAKPDLIRMILADQQPVPVQPADVVDNSSFLTPTLQEVLDGLTPLEKAVLRAHLDEGMACNGAETLDAMRQDNMTYSDVAGTSRLTGLSKKQVTGVISSLATKGLLSTDLEKPNGAPGVDQVLTDFGVVVAFELLADAAVKKTKVEKRAPRGPGPDGILIQPGDVQKEPRAGTKRAQLLDLLRSTEGATIDEIAAALSWRRDVASSSIYVDVAASGYGVERRLGRLHLIGGAK